MGDSSNAIYWLSCFQCWPMEVPFLSIRNQSFVFFNSGGIEAWGKVSGMVGSLATNEGWIEKFSWLLYVIFSLLFSSILGAALIPTWSNLSDWISALLNYQFLYAYIYMGSYSAKMYLLRIAWEVTLLPPHKIPYDKSNPLTLTNPPWIVELSPTLIWH